MKKLKHTPGPWRVIDGWDENGNGTYFPSVIMNNDLKSKHPEIIINESHDHEQASIMANAKLIAAAPDMLEALLAAQKFMNGEDILAPHPKDIIKVAIDKATK